MTERQTNGKASAHVDVNAPDAETRALNDNAEFQRLMAESEQSIKEGRTRPAAQVFRRQRERRTRVATQ